MDPWPETPCAETFALPVGREAHRLDVYLTEGQLIDVHLDGQSVHPTWFKIEWKETGEVSAKVKGVKLTTRFGDTINLHQAASA